MCMKTGKGMKCVGKDLWKLSCSNLLLKAEPIRLGFSDYWLIVFWDYEVTLDNWSTFLMPGTVFCCLTRTLLATACVCCHLSLCCAHTKVLLRVLLTHQWVFLCLWSISATWGWTKPFILSLCITSCWWLSFGLALVYTNLLQQSPKLLTVIQVRPDKQPESQILFSSCFLSSWPLVCSVIWAIDAEARLHFYFCCISRDFC